MDLFDLDKFSQNSALIRENNNQISYHQLLKKSNEIGVYIKKRCLVFLVCKNCFESVAGYVGIINSKAVPILINYTINNIFFSQLLEAYKPGYIYLPSEISQFNSNFSIVSSFGNYSLLKTSYNKEYVIHKDLALLLTTSGSTGSPKLVRQSFKNVYSNAESISKYLEIKCNDRVITTMPMSYSYGLSIINSHLLKGASIILTDATIVEKRFWKEIKDNGATTFGGVPYIYEMLKKLGFAKIDLPMLRYITQAGGKLDQKLSEEFSDICAKKNIKFFVMYGQTEATSRMSYLSWEYARKKAGSIGKAIPGGNFWIEDDNGIIIEDNDKPGELIYRGDNVTMGYAETYHDLCKDDENKGILRTGDIAKRDVDGFYFIVGRKKRFLKMFGNRVNLDEIETLVKPLCTDCACTGTDDNLKIYITQLNDDHDVLRYIAKCTGINQSSLSLIFVDKIPRNDSGKVQYSVLECMS